MANDHVENSTENLENNNLPTSVETPEVTNPTEEQAPAPIAVEAENSNVAAEAAPEATSQKAEPEKADPVNTEKLDKIFAELKEVKENDSNIEVEVTSRIRGGLRVMYDIMPMFLPTSHFGKDRNPSEDDINSAVGTKINVKIHELDEDATGRKTVIVSRRALLDEEVWSNIEVGQIIEGTVTSIAPFGVFLDLGGVEGLIHISRLTVGHIDDPKKFTQRGEKLKAKIIAVDKAKNRISLSHQEFAASPWVGLSETFPDGSVAKGKVKRLTDFGAYVELKEGVDGLLRTNEISWTKRIARPGDVLQKGSVIDVFVVNLNEEKQTATLSLKRLSENPWIAMKNNYPEGTELKGKVTQIMPQGCIVNVKGDFEIDGFMPKSKARPILKDNKLPFNVGDEIDVAVVDIIIDDESLILSPVMEDSLVEEFENQQKSFKQSKSSQPKRQAPVKKVEPKVDSSSSSFSFGDLLSDKALDKLKNIGN